MVVVVVARFAEVEQVVRLVQARRRPVRVARRQQPAQPAAEEVRAVVEGAARERRAAAARLEVPVAAAVQLLVGRHAEAHHLRRPRRALVRRRASAPAADVRRPLTHQVQLAAGEHRDPEEVEERVERHPGEPSVAPQPAERGVERRGRVAALRGEVLHAAPQHPDAHHQQAHQETDEILVVFGAWEIYHLSLSFMSHYCHDTNSHL